MTTKETIEYLLKQTSFSKYKLAQILGVTPMSIHQYLNNGTRMSSATASRVEAQFNIKVSDTWKR